MTDQLSPCPSFRHEAFFYADEAQYVGQVAEFFAEGRKGHEPILVAVPTAKIDLLRTELEPETLAGVRMVAMEDVGRNPAWIIPAWSEFVDECGWDRPARGIGEPTWAERSPDEIVECGRYEALVNSAFAHAASFTLLCPYDTGALPPDVVAEARRNHPHVIVAGERSVSTQYADDVPDMMVAPLPVRPDDASVWFFDGEVMTSRRIGIGDIVGPALADRARLDGYLLAVGEAMANSVRHGGGAGEIALWPIPGGFVCEITDRGRLEDPLAGRRRPAVESGGGRGLWLMHQMCDLVQIRAVPTGQVIRLHLRIDCEPEPAVDR